MFRMFLMFLLLCQASYAIYPIRSDFTGEVKYFGNTEKENISGEVYSYGKKVEKHESDVEGNYVIIWDMGPCIEEGGNTHTDFCGGNYLYDKLINPTKFFETQSIQKGDVVGYTNDKSYKPKSAEDIVERWM